jgi:Ankyrin repeats (3 copies)/Ankyrin repeat
MKKLLLILCIFIAHTLNANLTLIDFFSLAGNVQNLRGTKIDAALVHFVPLHAQHAVKDLIKPSEQETLLLINDIKAFVNKTLTEGECSTFATERQNQLNDRLFTILRTEATTEQERKAQQDAISNLINEGANIEAHFVYPHGGPPYKRTPLFIAIRQHRLDLVELLLNLGAHVNAKDSEDKTPLMVAAQFELAIVKKLLEQPTIDIDAQDASGETALMDAVRHDHDGDIITVLLEHCADITLQSKPDGYTAEKLANLFNSKAAELIKNASKIQKNCPRKRS